MNIKKTLFALSLLCSTIVQGHNFEVDGIYYNIIDKKTFQSLTKETATMNSRTNTQTA